MRGSIAPEPEDFCIFICLNAALLGPPKPNSVLQSLVSICCTLFLCTFSNFPGGGDDPPLQKSRGDVSPPPVPPGSPPLLPRNSGRLWLYLNERSVLSSDALKLVKYQLSVEFGDQCFRLNLAHATSS